MQAKSQRSLTNIVFVVILALTLLAAADFSWRLIKYAMDGSLS